MSELVICRHCGRQVETLTLCECRANAFQPIAGFRMMPVDILAQIEEHENRRVPIAAPRETTHEGDESI